MREMTFIIDDKKGFEKHGHQLTGKIFQVKYTLKKDEKGICYELYDFNGNQLNIIDLSGYEKMYTDECFSAFMQDREITEEFKDFIEIESPKETNLNEGSMNL